MAQYQGTTTINSTGNEAIELPFTPTWYELRCAGKVSGSESVNHRSYGTYQEADESSYYESNYSGSSGGDISDPGTDYVLRLKDWISGSLQDRIRIAHGAINTDEIVLDVEVTDGTYLIFFRAGDDSTGIFARMTNRVKRLLRRGK